MVASSCKKTGSLSSERCNIRPVVRATCSNVIAGFFFPKLRCLGHQYVHTDSRTKPVAYQALVSLHFERAEPALLLGPFEPLFRNCPFSRSGTVEYYT